MWPHPPGRVNSERESSPPASAAPVPEAPRPGVKESRVSSTCTGVSPEPRLEKESSALSVFTAEVKKAGGSCGEGAGRLAG